ncbi:MAG: XRE family transcriptional regulator [Desulfarculaceae bacterium]|jgi:transcriptional regulator with XRE-family HTH domain
MKDKDFPLIGKSIKDIRIRNDLTLEALSKKSGVSKAMLSQIESDKVNPTIMTLWKIAQGLNVDINQLTAKLTSKQRQFYITRQEDAPTLDSNFRGTSIKILTPTSIIDDLEMYLIRLEPKSKMVSTAHFPGTEEFLTIFQGTVKVIAGDNDAQIRKGDFIIYNSDIDHQLVNIGKTTALVHMVVRYKGKKPD